VSISRVGAAASSESGAVLIIVSVALTALVLIAAFVLDAANWYEHKRHLQLQADAAAFAGAHSLAVGGCSNSLISADAHRYGGSYLDSSGNVQTEPYNDQVGGTSPSKIHILINSSGYYGDAGAGDNSDPNGAPCTAQYVDIKATETNLPWFFGFGGIVSRINAHARVALVQESQANGTLPIAVPNPLPTSAAAIFVDEANSNNVVKALPLFDLGPSGGLDMWQSDSAFPPQFTLPSRKTSIVIALSGKKNLSLSGNLAAICDQTLTDCYDSSTDPPTNGLSFIRGYAAAGPSPGTQPQPPYMGKVELVGGTCSNASNSPYFASNTSNCQYELVAGIDAALQGGGTMPNANQIYRANGVQLYPDPDPNCNVVSPDTCWHALLTLPPGSGPNDIKMTWEETTGCLQVGGCTRPSDFCDSSGGNKCKGSFDSGDVIQRAYSAVTADPPNHSSGPIKIVKLCNWETDPSCATEDSHSYLVGSPHRFVVTVGIAGTLQNATSTSDPLVTLRLRSGQQSLDCDPGYQNLKQELANGCRPSYTLNTGTPDCSTINTNTLWASQQPWSCIAVSTGRQPNDVAAGLNTRIYGTDKPPNNYVPCSTSTQGLTPAGLGQLGYNNWPLFVNGYTPTSGDWRGQDGFPIGDPRVLDTYITTYGAFSHVNGTSGSVPIIGFGHFYVTGYIGNGGGFDPPTNCKMDPVPNNDSGLIVGHFIRYVDTVGGTGTQPCVPNSINACVIVMTK
jgi:putative Flp pilus-assembly TadE/G-like protein